MLTANPVAQKVFFQTPEAGQVIVALTDLLADSACCRI